MALVAFAEAGSDVEGRKQRRCARGGRKNGSGVQERQASSAALVARDQGPVSGSSRRRSTPTPDWAAIGKDQRCRAPCRRTKGHWKLECLRAMRLQAESVPNPTDRRVRKASLRRHRTDRPVRCIFWRGAERALDHSGDLIIVNRSRPPWTSLIQEPFDAVRQKAPTPLPDRVFMDAELARDGFARDAVRASEDDPQRSDKDRATRWRRTCRSRYAPPHLNSVSRAQSGALSRWP